MDLNRRQFLQYGSIALLAPKLSLAQVEVFSSSGQQLAILQGATDASSTQIAIHHASGKHYDYYVASGSTTLRPEILFTKTGPAGDWSITQIYVDGLGPDTDYELLVLEQGRIIDRRIFKALDLEKNVARVAVASCMQDYLHHRGIWDELWMAAPDLIIFAGDTVYADLDLKGSNPADEAKLWKRYSETRERLQGFRQATLIPILAVWDDHDFGLNNANRDFPHKLMAKEVFESFFAQDANFCSALTAGPGISRRFSAFGQNFFLLDGRSFRTADFADDEAIFGQALSTWLYDGIADTQKPSWLVSGSQFFGKYRAKDAFESNYQGQFRAFVERLKDLRGTYGFISGDIHYSEALEIEQDFLGYKTLEITSSSMHSFTFPGQHLRFRNPRRMGATSFHNFQVLDIEAGHEDLKVQTRCLRSGSQAFEARFHIAPRSFV